MTDTRTTTVTDENSYNGETIRRMNGGEVTAIGVVDALNPDGTYESGYMSDSVMYQVFAEDVDLSDYENFSDDEN